MTPSLTVEPYTRDDQAACLRILKSNTPRFFAPDERADFRTFLAALPGPFWVMRRWPDGSIVGCGGVSVTDGGRSAWLRWGMVAAEHHGQGIGWRLLEARLRWIAAQPAVETIRVATSSEVSGFFERMGFDLIRITTDFYGPERARHDLELRRGGERVWWSRFNGEA